MHAVIDDLSRLTTYLAHKLQLASSSQQDYRPGEDKEHQYNHRWDLVCYYVFITATGIQLLKSNHSTHTYPTPPPTHTHTHTNTSTHTRTRSMGNHQSEEQPAQEDDSSSPRLYQLAQLGPGQLPIIYSPDYNISFWGLQNIHPFDSGKWGKVYNYLIGQWVP